ncbi:PQQ-binding-like beta-propeller repeat protein [Janibacter anophelis]|uniref:PQQ-binding-like beta-propeller repeat protein n=1 Tax=Janibacter anophelis TaxID=319054 RepID=UPI000DEFA7BE|nr:PQQ-binding-like beta-propeller repeat protein [Janibacter anophelis]
MRLIRTTSIAIAASVVLLGAPAVAAAAAPTTAGLASADAARAAEVDVRIGGWAEGSAILPDGDILVSNLTGHRIERIDAQSHQIRAVAEVADPSQMVVDGDTLYVVTGNSPASVFLRKGGVVAIDLSTGARRTVTSGLGEANGLARLPDGELIVSVTLGHGAGVHRVDPPHG